MTQLHVRPTDDQEVDWLQSPVTKYFSHNPV